MLVLAISLMAFGFSTDHSNKSAAIDINRVKRDMIQYGEGWIPATFIEEQDTSLFSVFYFQDTLCLVHLPFKNLFSEPSMKTSLIAVYIMEKDTWKYQDILPFYYNITVLDKLSKTFLSNNYFCKSNGLCDSYVEVSSFDGKSFVELVSYNGFDKIIYHDWLLNINNVKELDYAIGDTIVNKYDLEGFIFDEVRLKSYQIRHEIVTLTAYADTLVTEKQIQNVTKILR